MMAKKKSLLICFFLLLVLEQDVLSSSDKNLERVKTFEGTYPLQ